MRSLGRSVNLESIQEHCRPQPRETLIRSRNFLNLNNQNLDNTNEPLNLNRSASSNDTILSSTCPANNQHQHQHQQQQQFFEAVYVNFGTQTSFSDEFYALNSDEQFNLDSIGSDAKHHESESEYAEIDGEPSENDPSMTKRNANKPGEKLHAKDTSRNHQKQQQAQVLYSNQVGQEFRAASQEFPKAPLEAETTHPGQNQKIDMLRQLLLVERQRNEQRHNNNKTLGKYLNQLQTDYLRLQQDLIEALELGHKIKAQKEAQLESLNETLRQKDNHIMQLTASLDETQVHKEFKELLEKQSRLANVEKQQLREQIETVEQQLVRERVNSSQILQQFQTRLDDQLKSHSSECEILNGKIAKLETELEKLMEEPKNLVIKELREENCTLIVQLEDFQVNLNESKQRHQFLCKRIEGLMEEQKLADQRAEEEIKSLHDQIAEQRKTIGELTNQLSDHEEFAQINQFNLQRSEKRSVELLTIVKEKEDTYKKVIEELNTKSGQTIEKMRYEMRELERRISERDDQLEKKQNEIVRLEMERENQLESLRNDRDERLKRSDSMKRKLQKQLETLEVKMAREMESNDQRGKLIEELQKDALHFREEAKHLSIELAKSQAKLYAIQQEQARTEKQLFEIRESNAHAIKSEDSKRQIRRHAKRLEDTVNELKEDNERLRLKLKVNEATISKLASSLDFS